MHEVSRWKISRSGHTLTVKGLVQGEPVKLTGIKIVQLEHGKIIARDDSGAVADLLLTE